MGSRTRTTAKQQATNRAAFKNQQVPIDIDSTMDPEMAATLGGERSRLLKRKAMFGALTPARKRRKKNIFGF
jgi:hypothetical protein